MIIPFPHDISVEIILHFFTLKSCPETFSRKKTCVNGFIVLCVFSTDRRSTSLKTILISNCCCTTFIWSPFIFYFYPCSSEILKWPLVVNPQLNLNNRKNTHNKTKQNIQLIAELGGNKKIAHISEPLTHSITHSKKAGTSLADIKTQTFEPVGNPP